MKFIVNLKNAHIASGLSKYRVVKDTGLSFNTVTKYVDADGVEFGQLPTQVIELCEYYGVDWRDPSIVSISIEDAPEGQRKTPLPATA